jgi:bifunctional aspartokinase / homoserine dehydrogenase 1
MSPEVQQEVPEEHSPDGALAPACAARSRAPSREVLAFKFGGSSLLGAERMSRAASLVREAAAQSRVSGFVLANPEPRNVVVVVSAMKGVTDRLLAIASALHAGRSDDALRDAEHILYVHFDVLRELRLDPFAAERVARDLRLLGKDLFHDAVENTSAAALSPEALHDRLASYGERFSTRLFAAALEKLGVPSVPVSSSEFVLTCDTFRDAQPHLEETRRRGREILLPLFADGLVPVVTGFIGSTADGRVTTLGRNSSDFSGALVAHVVDADELVIWTDVDGIYSANPRESAEARLLHELSYDQAHALAAAGAKVLHAKVLPLAAETEMVVWVRNTFNPRHRGTRIGPSPTTCHSEPSEPALADERSRGIPLPLSATNNSVVAAPHGCHNSNPRGAA